MSEVPPTDRAAILHAAVDGDLDAVRTVRAWSHDELRAVASVMTLCLSPATVVSVLKQLDSGAPPSEIQLWASFVLHGFAEGVGRGPIRPIDIEFDEATERQIVEAIARLDEIGDLVDGEVTRDEIRDLIASLS